MNSLARVGIAFFPALMLLAAPFIVNRDEPRVLGLPLLLAWIILWVLLTPVFMLAADRLRVRL